MQFDRDEFALLSRGGRVPRSSRAGPSYDYVPVRSRESRLRRLAVAAMHRVAEVRARRAGVRATWTVFGEGEDR
jgi:hypothetical protein